MELRYATDETDGDRWLHAASTRGERPDARHVRRRVRRDAATCPPPIHQRLVQTRDVVERDEWNGESAHHCRADGDRSNRPGERTEEKKSRRGLG